MSDAGWYAKQIDYCVYTVKVSGPDHNSASNAEADYGIAKALARYRLFGRVQFKTMYGASFHIDVMSYKFSMESDAISWRKLGMQALHVNEDGVYQTQTYFIHQDETLTFRVNYDSESEECMDEYDICEVEECEHNGEAHEDECSFVEKVWVYT